eukprot:SM003593S13375  [mRNA]  locus=s3593:194:1103:+ [translate_table: standard]
MGPITWRCCQASGSSDSGGREAGRAFCFLPLPVATGLPVHVNGCFELSSNRRDVWHGGDMDRAGRLRSDWNRCLLEDVVAPAYAALLQEAAEALGPGAAYDTLWPTAGSGTAEPWLGLARAVYAKAAGLPLLASIGGGGGGVRWLRPTDALFHDEECSGLRC